LGLQIIKDSKDESETKKTKKQVLKNDLEVKFFLQELVDESPDKITDGKQD